MLFDMFWTDVLRSLMPWASLFYRGITELGSDYVFVALIAVGYWALDKHSSIVIAFLMILSVATNYWLKVALRHPRPPQTYWMTGVEAINYSLPSAHAQNSVCFWGWLGIKVKKWGMGVLSTCLTVLIGLSRIFLGVHWLGDVLVGWIIGILFLVLVWKFKEPAQSFLSKYSTNTLYLTLVFFGIGVTILTELLAPISIDGVDDNFGANGGLIIGLGLGLYLEKRYVNFELTPHNKKKRRLGIRVLFGLLLVFMIMIGLSTILASNIYWLRAIRYALVTLVVMFIWPLVFTRLGL